MADDALIGMDRRLQTGRAYVAAWHTRVSARASAKA